MLMTLSTTMASVPDAPATDLGYLVHKHPGRAQSFPVATGTAHVLWPRPAPSAARWRCCWRSTPSGWSAAGPAGRSSRCLSTSATAPTPALREYALGIEPLWRVHEAVFAVLALESEPVDPRL